MLFGLLLASVTNIHFHWILLCGSMHILFGCAFFCHFCSTCLRCLATLFPSKLSHELWWDQCAICILYVDVDRQSVSSYRITNQSCFCTADHTIAFIQKMMNHVGLLIGNFSVKDSPRFKCQQIILGEKARKNALSMQLNRCLKNNNKTKKKSDPISCILLT